jgi:hypothetical protein
MPIPSEAWAAKEAERYAAQEAAQRAADEDRRRFWAAALAARA